ncbi:hypothetical protein M758_UG069400 [Ceratodon purpureus]|nr:hypothetical protein M758_UG069400 [Ceratodon purpureus]
MALSFDTVALSMAALVSASTVPCLCLHSAASSLAASHCSLMAAKRASAVVQRFCNTNKTN